MMEPYNDGNMERIMELEAELAELRDWKAGALGALAISYPPRVGPHTESAYLAHRSAYLGGSESYRLGADAVAEALDSADVAEVHARIAETKREAMLSLKELEDIIED